MSKELEKAAKEYSRNGNYQFMSTFQQMAQKAFVAGANWQASNTKSKFKRLNLQRVKDKMEETSKNNENAQLGIGAVSSCFSLLMLTSRLLTLEFELKEANLQMLTYPNEFTDQQIAVITPMIEDLRKAVTVLQNGY